MEGMIVYSKVTDEPTEFVTLDQVKKQVKMEGTSIDDSYLTALITTARIACEKETGRSFAEQTRRINLDRFPDACYHNYERRIVIPYGPVQAITSFQYYDTDGNQQSLTLNTDYRIDLDSDLCRVEPVDSWPATLRRMNAVTITYTAGYTSVPQNVTDAILRIVAALYEFRTDKINGSIADLDLTASVMLDHLRVNWNAWSY